MTAYEALRQRHLSDMRARVPDTMARLDWSAEQLSAERTRQLRELVRIAKQHSGWHRRRLARFDAGTLNEQALRDMPPMTKDDLMANFDEIVTDPRLRLELAETHLANLKSDAYLIDRYHVCASGGASGKRAVSIWDWDAWAKGWAAFLGALKRLRLRDQHVSLSSGPIITAGIAALNTTHMSSALMQTFSDRATLTLHPFPVTLPFAQIVAGIEALQPELLVGYSSMLHQLAAAAQDGALHIAPKLVISVSEPLLPEIRAAIRTAWTTARLLNLWATTEAMTMAISCGFGSGMHLNDDQLIIEPVDATDAPVRAGERAAKVYVTNLINPVLPLIRYEITDEVTLIDVPCPCGSAHRRVDDIEGRLDDMFTYSGAGVIHPHVFRSRLGREQHIIEYQVCQTNDGAQIALHCSGPVDLADLRAGLIGDLHQFGLAQPRIELTRVQQIERQASGKLKRFVPLPQVRN